MKKIWLVFGVLFIGACTTVPDRTAEMRADANRVQSYCAGLFRDPALDPIRTKVAVFEERETTVQMIADNSKATDSEKPVLLIWAKKKQDCVREGVSSMRRFSPPVAPQLIALQEATSRRFDVLVADLYKQELTYGEFARKRRDLATERAAKIEELRQAAAQRSAQERAASQRQWESQQAGQQQQAHEKEVACIQAGGTWMGTICSPGSREIRIVR